MQSKQGIKMYIFMVSGIIITAMLIWFMVSYNALVGKEEALKTAWSQVESNLQRKVDLLPNLVKTVKAYAKHETQLYTKIVALRSQASSVLAQGNADADKENIAKVKALQNALKQSSLQLFAVAENYPQLRSSEQFLQLQSQIEGAENRINITRMQFNDAVGEFNRYMRTFPAKIVAGMGGFVRKAYFISDEKAHQTLELKL